MTQNKVLASVDGKEITQQDVYNFLMQLDPQTAGQFQGPEGINQIAGELVNQELLYLDAIKNGLDKEEEFKSELEKMEASMLKQYAVNNLVKNIQVTEEEIAEFYKENKERFQKPEMMNASHILVEDKEKANEVIKEINNGLSFEEAAGKYSSCQSKENGGNLGEFGKGQMVPEFEEAAFALEENVVSEPVKSQFGYHIIKVNSKTEAGISTLEEAKPQIGQQLTIMKQQEIYTAKTKELSEEYKVETYF